MKVLEVVELPCAPTPRNIRYIRTCVRDGQFRRWNPIGFSVDVDYLDRKAVASRFR
jgi:hypothetical protein